MRTKQSTQNGFTLIEVLVVAPLVILLIGITIGYLSSLTGDGLKTQQKNVLAYNTQDALGIIDQDVSYSLSFKQSSGTVNSPQGVNSTTAAFTSNSGNMLVLESAATDKNRLDPSRQLIQTGTGTCDTTKPLYTYYTIYFVSAAILYKRTILPSASTCATPVQLNSCSADKLQQATPPANCKVEDEALATDITSFSIEYQANGAVIPAQNADDATKIALTLVAAKTIAGENIAYTGTLRSTKVSNYGNTGAN